MQRQFPISFSRLRGGLIGNTGAQAFALAVQLVVALVTVPVFARQWGLETYGIWLLFFTIPGYLVLIDFGFGGASANAMTAAVARGEDSAARTLYRELTGTTSVGALIVLAAIAALFLGPARGLLDFAEKAAGGHAVEVIIALAAYALFNLVTRALWCSLRATGHYAAGTYVIGGAALISVILAATAALTGGGLMWTAIGYAAGGATGLATMLWLCRRLAPQFSPAWSPQGTKHLAPLAGPAVALIVAQLAQVLVLQGSVAALGAAAGAVAVPAFTSLRTIARVGIQSVSVVSQAVTPELTMARARGDSERTHNLVALNLAVALVLLVPACMIFLFFGRGILDLWSGGVISAPFGLVAAVTAMLGLGCMWGPLTSFLAADNRQSSYALAFLLFAAGGIALAYLWALHWGATGAASAMALVDIALLVWTWRQARRADYIDWPSLLAAPRRAAKMVMTALGKH